MEIIIKAAQLHMMPVCISKAHLEAEVIRFIWLSVKFDIFGVCVCFQINL